MKVRKTGKHRETKIVSEKSRGIEGKKRGRNKR